jgi:hypothetical protein
MIVRMMSLAFTARKMNPMARMREMDESKTMFKARETDENKTMFKTGRTNLTGRMQERNANTTMARSILHIDQFIHYAFY